MNCYKRNKFLRSNVASLFTVLTIIACSFTVSDIAIAGSSDNNEPADRVVDKNASYQFNGVAKSGLKDFNAGGEPILSNARRYSQIGIISASKPSATPVVTAYNNLRELDPGFDFSNYETRKSEDIQADIESILAKADLIDAEAISYKAKLTSLQTLTSLHSKKMLLDSELKRASLIEAYENATAAPFTVFSAKSGAPLFGTSLVDYSDRNGS